MDTIEVLKKQLAEERKKRAKIRQHEYYLANKEKYIEAARRYQQTHKEKMKVYQKQYFQKLKGTVRYRNRLNQQKTVKQIGKQQLKKTVKETAVQTVELTAIETVKPKIITVTDESFTVSFE